MRSSLYTGLSHRRKMRKLLKLLIIFLPWALKRRALGRFFGYRLDPSARIGFAFIYPENLEMKPHSRIDHLNVAVNLTLIYLGEHSTISRGNWITGFPKHQAPHFAHLPNRAPELVIGRHSAITKNHHIDCTARILIGDFVTIAGYRSQLLTHSINIVENYQDAQSIEIGDYCFVGTNSVILGGAKLPANSVLGAKSLLNKSFDDGFYLYAGVPAKPVKALPVDAKYFSRAVGFVD